MTMITTSVFKNNQTQAVRFPKSVALDESIKKVCITIMGMNLKAKLTMRKAYDFRTVECLQIALYHEIGKFPEPDFNHRFC